MTDVWTDLRFLVGGDYRTGFTPQEKLDLLAQMVANLIDEVEILKQSAWLQSGLSWPQWQERYRKERMALLFSGQGSPPACLRKYQSYLQDRTETAAEMMPDEAERGDAINGLMTQT